MRTTDKAGSSRDGRLKRPFNVNNRRVAPTNEEKVCLSSISEGSEHSSSSTSNSVFTAQTGKISDTSTISSHGGNRLVGIEGVL